MKDAKSRGTQGMNNPRLQKNFAMCETECKTPSYTRTQPGVMKGIPELYIECTTPGPGLSQDSSSCDEGCSRVTHEMYNPGIQFPPYTRNVQPVEYTRSQRGVK